MLLYWIWFSELNIPMTEKHRLLTRFGDPEALYHSGENQDKDLQGAEEILRKCNRKNIRLLPIDDAAYPARLRNTPDAPVLLYYKGILPDWDSVPFIGVVGTRKASAYGLQVAHQMGSQIAQSGGFVVSGGASGIDTAAMQGALDAGCPVIGVLGCGVDVVYPRHNRRLFETVAQNGCLISEYPPEAEGLPWHFPARNRIISGMSNGTLIVEAPKVSGALITARWALEQGRDVFVVPGNINTVTCEGSNALLQEGATPVFCGWDVVSNYEILYPGKLQKHRKTPLYTGEETTAKVAQTAQKPTEKPTGEEIRRKKFIDNEENSTYSVVLENKKPALGNEEQAVLAQLTREPKETAELIAKLNMPSGKVLSLLTMLTVKGLAVKHPGGRFSLK